MKNLRWLFGFRSKTPWKMLLAGLYYLAGLAVLACGLFSPPFVAAEGIDLTIYRVSVVILFLWIESPAVFLSDTPLRRRLPFFRDWTLLRSMVGMMIVFVLFAYLFAAVERGHTAQYQSALTGMQAQAAQQGRQAQAP